MAVMAAGVRENDKELIRKSAVKLKEPYSVHLIADFECPKFIDDEEEIERILYEAAKAANNTPLKTSVHQFPMQGVTGVILLAESHISIHTWPEHNYLAIDIFTCGRQTKPQAALEYFKSVFMPTRVKTQLIERGRP